MKKLIMINGTMGIGKTTICESLYKSINNSCWLDGDWCWTMNPFRVTEENIEMVLNNITHLLNNFLSNTLFEYVIFNWVMHYESIISSVLEGLDIKSNFEVIKITLVCSEEELERRINKDIGAGLRDVDSLSRSIERLALYKDMDTIKVDVSGKKVVETVDRIKQLIGYSN